MNSTTIGIDSKGIWTAEQYVIDSGWDSSSVASTASLGVSREDRKTLTGKQSDALLKYCVAKTAEEWAEYASAVEAAEAFGWEDPTPEGGERDSTAERAALEFLQDETAVIEISSGVLVRDF